MVEQGGPPRNLHDQGSEPGCAAPLGQVVVAVQVGGRTLYRLRASGADAAGVCRRLQVAGEACSTVG
jgi:hypothetical protein